MKALILRNQVVQVTDTAFPVHPELHWIDIPPGVPVAAGWIYTGSSFVEPPPMAPGTGGAGGSGIGGDINIGGDGGSGMIGGRGGDGIGPGLNIGGRGGVAIGSAQSFPAPAAKTPWWKTA